MSRFLFWIALVILIVTTGCAGDPESVRPTQGGGSSVDDDPFASLQAGVGCQKGVDAFSQAVHPLLRRDCLPCHDIGGLSGKPHSVADVDKSYARIIGYVNWGVIDESFFIKKGGNRHCVGHGGNCQSTEEDIRKVVHDWWDMGQKECPNFGNFITRPEVISASSQVIRFSLSHLIPNVGPIALQVEVAEVDSLYVLGRPRLIGHTVPVTVSGLKILLNGTLQAAANRWSLVRSSLLPDKSEAPLLTVDEVQMPIISPGKDELSIGIDVLRARETFGCQKLPQFEQNVMPTLARRSCYKCHGGGASNAPGEPLAKHSLDMAVPNDLLCQKLLVRSGTRFPLDSPLIALPVHGRLGHPRAIPLSSEVLPAWVDWVRAENLN